MNILKLFLCFGHDNYVTERADKWGRQAVQTTKAASLSICACLFLLTMQYCSVEVGRGWLISKIKILVQELGGQRREGLIIGRIRRMWHVHVCHRVSVIILSVCLHVTTKSTASPFGSLWCFQGFWYVTFTENVLHKSYTSLNWWILRDSGWLL